VRACTCVSVCASALFVEWVCLFDVCCVFVCVRIRMLIRDSKNYLSIKTTIC
jgi:hypothetical protein